MNPILSCTDFLPYQLNSLQIWAGLAFVCRQTRFGALLAIPRKFFLVELLNVACKILRIIWRGTCHQYLFTNIFADERREAFLWRLLRHDLSAISQMIIMGYTFTSLSNLGLRNLCTQLLGWIGYCQRLFPIKIYFLLLGKIALASLGTKILSLSLLCWNFDFDHEMRGDIAKKVDRDFAIIGKILVLWKSVSCLIFGLLFSYFFHLNSFWW